MLVVKRYCIATHDGVGGWGGEGRVSDISAHWKVCAEERHSVENNSRDMKTPAWRDQCRALA